MNFLLKINVGRDRRSNVVVLECFNCRWEGVEVGRWKSWKGSEVGRWGRWQSSETGMWEIGEVRRCEIPGFVQGRFLVLFKLVR